MELNQIIRTASQTLIALGTVWAAYAALFVSGAVI